MITFLFPSPTGKVGFLITFSYSLSHWEKVRVRAYAASPSSKFFCAA